LQQLLVMTMTMLRRVSAASRAATEHSPWATQHKGSASSNRPINVEHPCPKLVVINDLSSSAQNLDRTHTDMVFTARSNSSQVEVLQRF
jgi:hypothetical protein